MHEFIFFPQKGYLYPLNTETLIMIEAAENYVKCFYEEEMITIRTGLTKMMSKLPRGKFIQVSRIHIVPVKEIMKFNKEELYLYHAPEKPIGVGKQFYPKIMEQLVVLE